MGLRSRLDEFLSGLGQAQKGFQSASKTFDQMGLDRAKQAFQERMQAIGPQAISGDVASQAELLKLGGEAGIDPAEALKMAQAWQPKPQKQPIGTERAKELAATLPKSSGIDMEATIKMLEAQDEAEATRNIRNLRSSATQLISAGQRGAGESRRSKESIQKDLFTPIAQSSLKIKQEKTDFMKQLNQVDGFLKQGGAIAENAVLNFVARNISLEKGPLSDSDINRIVPKTGIATAQEFFNFISGNPSDKWTPEIKAAVREMFQVARGKAEVGFNEKLENVYKTVAQNSVYIDDPEVRDRLKKSAKESGLDLEFTGEGIVKTKKIIDPEIAKSMKESETELNELKKISPAAYEIVIKAAQDSGVKIRPGDVRKVIEAQKLKAEGKRRREAQGIGR